MCEKSATSFLQHLDRSYLWKAKEETSIFELIKYFTLILFHGSRDSYQDLWFSSMLFFRFAMSCYAHTMFQFMNFFSRNGLLRSVESEEKWNEKKESKKLLKSLGKAKWHDKINQKDSWLHATEQQQQKIKRHSDNPKLSLFNFS